MICIHEKYDKLIRNLPMSIAYENIEKIDKSKFDVWNTLSLNSGYPTIVLCLLKLMEIEHIEIDIKKEIGVYLEIIKIGITNNEIDFNNLSMIEGLSGLGMLLIELNGKGANVNVLLKSINKVLFNKISNSIEYRIKKYNIEDISDMDYDFILGFSATLRYLVELKNVYGNDYVKESVEKIGDYFNCIVKKININSLELDCIVIKNMTSKTASKKIDLGMAHGLAAVMSSISIAKINGVTFDSQEVLIEKLINTYLNTVVYSKELIYWPSIIELDNEEQLNGDILYLGNFSWCYGVCGVARALYLAGKAVNNIKAMEISIKAFDKIAKYSKFIEFDTAMICHGYAGTLMILNEMFKDTNNDKVGEACQVILEKIFALYKNDSIFGFESISSYKDKASEMCISLLEGNLGIILTIISYMESSENIVSKIFGIR